ncbi:MAG: hypothetical protein DRN20_04070 [Thermoplasmata archaeon]|nr:MAG: hypothetical protein DRN20_04070 [Thermoplasmata archaeon]
MWLVILAFTTAVVTALWYAGDDKYKLGTLCLILWGATIMVFVDHLLGYLIEGGEFLEVSADAALLGVVLVTVALLIWEFYLIVKDPKSRLKKILA